MCSVTGHSLTQNVPMQLAVIASWAGRLSEVATTCTASRGSCITNGNEQTSLNFPKKDRIPRNQGWEKPANWQGYSLRWASLFVCCLSVFGSLWGAFSHKDPLFVRWAPNLHIHFREFGLENMSLGILFAWRFHNLSKRKETLRQRVRLLEIRINTAQQRWRTKIGQ